MEPKMKIISLVKILLFLLILNTAITSLKAEFREKILLWPDGAPNALGTEDKDKPNIALWVPEKDKATGVAILVCPGGGYGGLAMGHEGSEIAEWFNNMGVTALILDYRHRGKGYGHPNPLLDAQRAIRLIRSKAKDWGVDPAKIGIMGFSAGGHLASTAGTHFDAGNKDAADPIEKMSSRPDFMILCYGVLTFDKPNTHQGSRNNLLGDEKDNAELVELYCNEKQVTEKTPPAFLFHTDEDTAVSPENSVMFYMAMRKHKVPAEMHIFRTGRHGIGLAKGMQGNEKWPGLCEDWLRNMEFLK